MKGHDVRLDELSPSLLALFALHPVLVELGDAVVRFFEELREVALHVFEDLVVKPTDGMMNDRVPGWQ